jgi:thiol:disulfide interchange protein
MLKHIIILSLITILFSCKVSKNPPNNGANSTTYDQSKEDNNISKQKQLTQSLAFYYNGTLTEVIEKAEMEDKLVFIDFTADWCAPCKLMEEEVYTYPSVYEFYNSNFINYRLDIQEGNGPNIAFLYEVKTLPTLLFLDNRGREVHRHIGSLGIEGILEHGKTALMKKDSIR